MDTDAEPAITGDMSGLTARQLGVLRLMAQGASNASIADSLGLSVKSVENIINAIYQVLGVSSLDSDSHPRVKAALIYLGAVGWPSPDRSAGPHGSASR